MLGVVGAELLLGAVAAAALIVIVLAFYSIRIIYQYERGVVFTLGKYSRTMGPGLNILVPYLQRLRKVDVRIKTIDIAKQEVMTKDNVPVMVNAVVYFRVDNPSQVILAIEDYIYAVSQYAQTALRDVIGNSELDFVLTEREKIAEGIRDIIEKETEEWGVDITSITIQDIELPANMKRVMARQAEAERERRAVVITSLGELAASGNIAAAAKKLGAQPGAIHLRTLQTLSDVSANQGTTIVAVAPVELLRALEGFAKKGRRDATL